MRICKKCFREVLNQYKVCQYCGTTYTEEPLEPIHLKPGTRLVDRYIIGLAEGSGGFGIIYRAWDTKLNSIVAIKEFFSGRLMTRAPGTEQVIVNRKARQEYDYRLTRFLAEAKNMAKFSSHRSIPNVFEFFEANGTAYIVMELLTGLSLNEYLQQHDGKLNQNFALFITNEIGQALCSLHEQGIIHRDVAPDNIFITDDPAPRIKLLDLGAAKLADGSEDATDIILKPGYSPPEQYDKSQKPGAWNDIYSLGATLYVMLTGVKPEESTNRKMKDRVISPAVLNHSVSENLSNAVMKAIAVDKHMRFSNVSDFLKAINGDKKVVTLAKEKKRHKRKRISGIAVACAILTVASIFVYHAYHMKRLEKQLDPAKIEVWYAAESNSSESAAMENVKRNFESVYPMVQIFLVRLDPKDYGQKIADAAKNEKLPALFESTDLSDSVLEKAAGVDVVLQSEQANSCSFLKQYDQYYTNHKRIPLGFEAPVAFVVTQGESAIDFYEDTFADLAELSAETNIAVDSRADKLIEKNFSEAVEFEFDENTFPGIQNNCAVLLSSTLHIQNVKRNNLSGYTWHCAYPEEKLICSYTYEWSLGDTQGNKKAAAERLLSWMLGNVYQNDLMISYAQDGQLPLNDVCFEEKCKKNPDLQVIDNAKNKIEFVN